MIYNYFISPEHVLLWFRLMIALSLLTASLQHLINRFQFAENGLLPWQIIKKKSANRLFRSKFFDYVFNLKGFIWLNAIRIFLLPLLVYGDNISVLIILIILSFGIYIRTKLMANAADQINNVALIGLLINVIFGQYSSPSVIIFFFSAVLLISYFTSGILKFHEAKWQNGYYLKSIIASRNGNSSFYLQLMESIPAEIFKLSSKMTIGWQITGVLIPFLPLPLLYLYLFIGLIFHVSTGILMKLPNFIWTFLAFLPCLFYTNIHLT